MRSLLFAAVIAFASAATGATLAVSTDKLTYLIGETISLTVIGDDAGVTSYGIQGRIDFNGAFVNLGTATQTQLAGQSGKFTVGTLPNVDNGGVGSFQFLFNQYSALPKEATNLPGILSTATLIAQAAGVVNVNWHVNAVDGFGLDFFGLTTAPGTEFCIVDEFGPACPFVPEPGTFGLLGLALLALAFARRSA